MSNPAGTWNLTVSTPFGPQELQLEIIVDGEEVHGTATHSSGSTPFEGGVYENDEVRFEVSLTAPVTADLTVNLKADGDTLTGSAKAGMLSFTAEGTRV
jgi:hypothetical protein